MQLSVRLNHFFERCSSAIAALLPSRFFLICAAPVVTLTLFMSSANAQPKEANYDEAKVPKYSLPDPLTLANGQKVTDAKTWRDKRRPEILEIFTTQMFGRGPGRPTGMTF